MSNADKNPSINAVLDLLSAQLADELELQNIPGMTAAVILDQEIIWSGAYGYANLDEKIPMTIQHLFRVGSITKLFTATMLMQLRDAGKLFLDEPLEKYEPRIKFKSSFPDPKPPTFRQVVSHTSGIPRESTLNFWKDLNFPQPDVLLENLEGAEIIFPPYSEFKYSNLGISLLGHTLSLIAGKPYRDYVKQAILEPLGMKDSGFDLTPEFYSKRAIGYVSDAEGKNFQPAPIFDLECISPAGQLYSNVIDMAKFISMQFSDKAAGGNQVVGGSTLREMHSPVFYGEGANKGTDIGIGWILAKTASGHRVIGHSGGIHGYVTQIGMIPAMKLGFAVFTNTMSDVGKICNEALELLAPVFNRLEKQAEILAERNFKIPPEWEKFIGTYEFAGQFVVVKIADGKLIFTNKEDNPQIRSQLVPEGENKFRMKGGGTSGEETSFILDEQGEVIHLKFGGYLSDRVKQA